MPTIECLNTVFETKINGEVIRVDFSKMHPTWVDAHLRKAAQRFLNDKHSDSDKGTKLELARAELADIHSGEPMPERERKVSVAKADPVRRMARDTCTAKLVAKFRAKPDAFGANESAWAKHKAIGKLFRVTEKGSVRFDLAAVDAYMAKQAESGGVDYMADAKAALNAAAEAVELDASEFDF